MKCLSSLLFIDFKFHVKFNFFRGSVIIIL
jgi:hypothetical protein